MLDKDGGLVHPLRPPSRIPSNPVSPHSLRARPHRHSSGERVFADAELRLWSAAFARHSGEWAVVFACITDARQPIRALALSDEHRLADVTEAMLREWLLSAPRIGPLT